MKKWYEFGKAHFDDEKKFRKWLLETLDFKAVEDKKLPRWHANVNFSLSILLQTVEKLLNQKPNLMIDVDMDKSSPNPCITVSFNRENAPAIIYVIPFNDIIFTCKDAVCYYRK